MFRALKCDFSRNLASGGSLCAIIVTTVLCFSMQVWTDYSNGRMYSAFEALFAIDRGFMAETADFNPVIIIRKTLAGYSAMALPITASFPFVFSFISERNSGNMRLSVSRTGRIRYYLSKFISAILGGGLCTMLGVLLFALLVFVLFPSTQSPEAVAVYLTDSLSVTVVKKALSSFVYGAVSVLPAFFLCSFCTNSYIIMCIPFLLKFVLETALSEITMNAAAARDTVISEIIQPFYPNAASLLFNMPLNRTFLMTLVVNLLFAAAMLAGFVLVMEKRADKGV